MCLFFQIPQIDLKVWLNPSKLLDLSLHAKETNWGEIDCSRLAKVWHDSVLMMESRPQVQTLSWSNGKEVRHEKVKYYQDSSTKKPINQPHVLHTFLLVGKTMLPTSIHSSKAHCSENAEINHFYWTAFVLHHHKRNYLLITYLF